MRRPTATSMPVGCIARPPPPTSRQRSWPTTETARAKGSGAVRFCVYVLAVLATLFGLLIIPLSALVGASGLA